MIHIRGRLVIYRALACFITDGMGCILARVNDRPDGNGYFEPCSHVLAVILKCMCILHTYMYVCIQCTCRVRSTYILHAVCIDKGKFERIELSRPH